MSPHVQVRPRMGALDRGLNSVATNSMAINSVAINSIATNSMAINSVAIEWPEIATLFIVNSNWSL